MRLIDLHFGADGEGECYLSAMPGPPGDWRPTSTAGARKWGCRNYSADELANLPKRPFLNREASLRELSMATSSLSGRRNRDKGFRLVGLVQPAPEFTLFVKMTGPKELDREKRSRLSSSSSSPSASSAELPPVSFCNLNRILYWCPSLLHPSAMHRPFSPGDRLPVVVRPGLDGALCSCSWSRCSARWSNSITDCW